MGLLLEKYNELLSKGDLKALAFYLCNDSQIAEDLTHETYFRIHRADERWKDKGEGSDHATKAYIIQAMRCVHLDIVRRPERDTFLPMWVSDDGQKTLVDIKPIEDEGDPLSLLIDEEEADARRALLTWCFEVMKAYIPEIRDCFIRRMNGDSFKKIAKETNVSVNTALGRWRYAIIYLKKEKYAIKQPANKALLRAS